MTASAHHAEYDSNLRDWELTRDAVKGPRAIKQRRTRYLPKPNPEDASPENDARYDDYLIRANYVNFTGATLDGMLGMVFRKPFIVELQSEIEYLLENTNGAGLTLEQMVRSLTSNVLQAGRHGLLVDYPAAPEGLTQAEAEGLQANIMPYPAESIVNWRTTTVGGNSRLSLVTLKEKHEVVSADGFVSELKDYHRVLRLEEDVYIQELYDDGDELVETIIPRDAKGQSWSFIPFVFVGAQNNDPSIDRAPLYDIAEVNVAHYRNSADFEESCYLVGQATPVLAGLSQSWVDTVMKGGVMLGSRKAILLPEGGSGSLLQAGENSMPERGMEAKEAQMIRLGARLITDAGGAETAEAARIRYAGQNSKLSAVVGNIESAMKQCFEWCMEFMGGAGENIFEINREYYDKKVDPQMIIARIQLLDRGVISKSVLQDKLRDEGEIDAEITNEMIDAQAESLI